MLRTVIPRSVKVSEAPGYGMTILDYDPGSRGAMSYLDASRELAERGAPPGSTDDTAEGDKHDANRHASGAASAAAWHR